jgi:hypothetical protein
MYLLQDNRGFVISGKTSDKGSNIDYFPTIWYHIFGKYRKDLDGHVVGYLK